MVRGYNFYHCLYNGKQITIKGEITARKYSEMIFGLAKELERKYEDMLLSLYGKTPEWYF